MKIKMFFKKLIRSDDVNYYLSSGRIPWSRGYKQYRYNFLSSIPENDELLDIFSNNSVLPKNYGFGLDERVVEYPWLLSKIKSSDRLILDAGSVLNYPFLLDAPQLVKKDLVIQTLVPESTIARRKNVSYFFGDLRNTIYNKNIFDLIVCISTLEHVGMDNAKIYTKDSSYNELRPDDHLQVIAELRRILKVHGRLLITVPYGRAENFGWLHQFDQEMVDRVINAFGSELISISYYKYEIEGWIRADAKACSDSIYFDVHSSTKPAADLAAAARSVACLEFIKID